MSHRSTGRKVFECVLFSEVCVVVIGRFVCSFVLVEAIGQWAIVIVGEAFMLRIKPRSTPFQLSRLVLIQNEDSFVVCLIVNCGCR